MAWFGLSKRQLVGQVIPSSGHNHRLTLWHELETLLTKTPVVASVSAELMSCIDGESQELISSLLALETPLNGEQQELVRILVAENEAARCAYAKGRLWEVVGNRDRAEISYRTCLANDKGFANAYNQLGLINLSREEWDLAIANFGHTVTLDAKSAVFWNNLGACLARVGEQDDALECFRKAWAISPKTHDVQRNLLNTALELRQTAIAREVVADALASRSTSLGDSALLSASFHGVLANDPVSVWPRVAEATLAMYLGEMERAKFLFEALIEVDPIASHTGLGTLASCRSDFDAAEKHYLAVATLYPGDPMALHNVAYSMALQGKVKEGLKVADRSLAVEKGTPIQLFLKAGMLLKTGQWKEGWAAHEARLRMPALQWATRDFQDGLQWAGETLTGKVLALVCEQGAGDVIQFVRYASVLSDLGAEVDVYCRSPLSRLLGTVPGVTRVLSEGDPLGYFDHWILMLSVPRILGTDESTIPARIPYVFPDADACHSWAERLKSPGKRLVGLVWGGNSYLGHKESFVDGRRSLQLALLAPLWEQENVSFFSIQKGTPCDQIKGFSTDHPIADYSEEWNDYADTAAFISGLDLVITVDTSVAHLAGALGKPVWILSRFDGCWRWLANRNDTPWYPTARIFHQEKPGDWLSVIARVSAALKENC